MPALHQPPSHQQQQQNYYATLSLPTPRTAGSGSGLGSPPLTQDAIRLAYRASLLRWHPDKTTHHLSSTTTTTTATTSGINNKNHGCCGSSSSPTSNSCCNGDGGRNGIAAGGAAGPTIDDIKMAYHILSDPRKRAAYDSEIATLGSGSGRAVHGFQNGMFPPSGDMSGYTVNRTCCGGAGGVGCNGGGSGVEEESFFIVGLGDSVPETVDLDDLVEEEEGGVVGAGSSSSGGMSWSRSCRCGLQRGFIVTESQLEEESDAGGREVLVQCQGCSLWLRVEFGVEES